ncbi:MAG: hypothetical protein SD837_21940 [Candidatus Electrothrix scaldis]|nr:MAG: hypothetical protein SD837_21940 [Candidatus Electrothrix sp. GW3-3]
MYDLNGDPIHLSLALVTVLLTARLMFEFKTQLLTYILNYIRKAGRLK